jgi:hypothetical protein
MQGWIKIHRKFLDWQWFNKSEAVHLFVYMLLKANHKDSQWQGIEVKRGEFISSLGKISSDTNISSQSIRTLLKKLENTNEIIVKSTNKYTQITICKYDCYQLDLEDTNKQLTNNQQTTNNQLTTNKNDKNKKNENNIPEIEDFVAYALEQFPNVDEDEVRLKYKSWLVNGWCTNRDNKLRPIKNWKSTLLNTLPYMKEKVITSDDRLVAHIKKTLNLKHL